MVHFDLEVYNDFGNHHRSHRNIATEKIQHRQKNAPKSKMLAVAKLRILVIRISLDSSVNKEYKKFMEFSFDFLLNFTSNAIVQLDDIIQTILRKDVKQSLP